MRAMNFDRWVKKYKPLKNALADALDFKFNSDVSILHDGYMFETYGRELAFVNECLRKNPLTVWTLVDGDNNKCYIITGAHLVNRIGYFITEVPYPKDGLSVLV